MVSGLVGCSPPTHGKCRLFGIGEGSRMVDGNADLRRSFVVGLRFEGEGKGGEGVGVGSVGSGRTTLVD